MGTPAEHLRQQYMRLVAGMQAATAELAMPELPPARRAMLSAHLERLQGAHRDFLTRYVSGSGAPIPGQPPAPPAAAPGSPAPIPTSPVAPLPAVRPPRPPAPAAHSPGVPLLAPAAPSAPAAASKRPSPAPTPVRAARPAVAAAQGHPSAAAAPRVALSRVSAADLLARTRPHGPVLVGALMPRDVSRGRAVSADARLSSHGPGAAADAQPRTVHLLVAEMAAMDAALAAAAREADYPAVPGLLCGPEAAGSGSVLAGASPVSGVSPSPSVSPVLSASPSVASPSYSGTSGDSHSRLPHMAGGVLRRHAPSSSDASSARYACVPVVTQDAEDILLALADRTLLTLCRAACEFAAHRRRPGLSLRDVEAALGQPGTPGEVARVGAALAVPAPVSSVRVVGRRGGGGSSSSGGASGGNPHASRMQQLRKYYASTGQL